MSPFSKSCILCSWVAGIAAMLGACAAAHGQAFSGNSFGGLGHTSGANNVGSVQHAHEFSAPADGQAPAAHHATIPTTWPQQHASFDAQADSQIGQIQTTAAEAVPESFHPNQQTSDPANASLNGTPNKILHESGSASGGMLESWIDKAGPAIAGMQETLNQKTGGWFGKIASKFSGGLSGGNGKLDISRMLASLALVVGCYFAFVWLMRKISPSGNRGLPAEVVQVLGRMPFGIKENLQLVRLGNKLVLLLTSLEHTQPIGEITDPQEVEYFTSLCQSGKQGRGALASAVSRSLTGRSATAAPASVGSNTAGNPPTQINVPPAADSFQPAHAVANSGDLGNSGLINVLRSLENTIRSRPQSTQSTLYEA